VAEPAHTAVLTQSGWFPLQDIVVGDRVLSSSGSFRQVMRVDTRRRGRVHRISLADGASAYATMDHPWNAEIDHDGWSMHSTLEISEALAASKMVSIPALVPPALCPVDPVFPVLQTRGMRLRGLRAVLDACAEKTSASMYFLQTDTWRVAALAYNLACSLGGLYLASPGTLHPLAAPAEVKSEPPSEIADLLTLETANREHRTLGALATYEGYISLPSMFPLVRQIAKVGSAFEHTVIDITLEGGFPHVTQDWVVTGGV
jgi:hypothetical protein